MFTLTQSTPTAGDCTAGYKVTLDKEYTLQEFIDAVLTNKGEWGYINVAKGDCAWYNYPRFSYRYGEVYGEPNLPEEVYGYKVKSVTASGGWSAMDYIVTLEKEVE